MTADMLGDHVARSPKSRDCDAEYATMNATCSTRERAKKTMSAPPRHDATRPSSDANDHHATKLDPFTLRYS
jgi:hypothetical protein